LRATRSNPESAQQLVRSGLLRVARKDDRGVLCNKDMSNENFLFAKFGGDTTKFGMFPPAQT
jgi:hypothetical protein